MIADRTSQMEQAMEQIDVLMSHQRRAFCSHSLHREISLPQLYLLVNLQERDRMTVSEISDLLGVTAPSASAIIDRMVERTWVTRERDDEDRRVVHVLLSDRGRVIIEELAGVKRDRIEGFLSRMNDDELSHVIAAVQAVCRVVESGPDDTSGAHRSLS